MRLHYFRVALLAALTLALNMPLRAAWARAELLEEPFPPTIDWSTLDGHYGFTFFNEYGYQIGSELDSAGDMNGDGIGDLVVAGGVQGLPSLAFVVFGRRHALGEFPAEISLSNLDGANGFVFVADFGGPLFGRQIAVASVGDINGDDLDDIVIGASISGRGREALVIYGRDTAVQGAYPAVVRSADVVGSFGFILKHSGTFNVSTVKGVGDLNADGVDDLAVSYAVSRGETLVVFGRDPAKTDPFPSVVDLRHLDGQNGFRFIGNTPGEQSGFAIAGRVDVNHDGIDDLLIGAPTANRFAPGLVRSGNTYVVYGRDTAASGSFPPTMSANDLDTRIGFIVSGGMSEEFSGSSIGGAGDVNGDGVDDFIVGAPGGPWLPLAGRAYVVFGRDAATQGRFPYRVVLDELDGINGFRLQSAGIGDLVGSFVSGGDINSDGIADIVVGGAGAADIGSEPRGLTFVLFGKDQTRGERYPAVVPIEFSSEGHGFYAEGLEDGDCTGCTLGVIGDFNGDGHRDLLVGAKGWRRLGIAGIGKAYVLFGRGLLACPADLDQDGELTIFDFLKFQNLFDLMDPLADFDGDGDFTVFDFLVFQNAFHGGCV